MMPDAPKASRLTADQIKQSGVEQRAARRDNRPKVAGSSPAPATSADSWNRCEVRRPYLATQNIVVYVQFEEGGPHFDLHGRAIEDLQPAQPLEPHPRFPECYRMKRKR